MVLDLELLLDTFIVRRLLVPALAVLVGPRNGWPGRPLGQRARGAARDAAGGRGLPVGNAPVRYDPGNAASTIEVATTGRRPSGIVRVGSACQAIIRSLYASLTVIT